MKAIVYRKGDGRDGWIRVLGYGVYWKHETDHKTFSERCGINRYYKLGRWYFKLLKPCPKL